MHYSFTYKVAAGVEGLKFCKTLMVTVGVKGLSMQIVAVSSEGRLAECRKRQLNRGSFAVFAFLSCI